MLSFSKKPQPRDPRDLDVIRIIMKQKQSVLNGRLRYYAIHRGTYCQAFFTALKVQHGGLFKGLFFVFKAVKSLSRKIVLENAVFFFGSRALKDFLIDERIYAPRNVVFDDGIELPGMFVIAALEIIYNHRGVDQDHLIRLA